MQDETIDTLVSIIGHTLENEAENTFQPDAIDWTPCWRYDEEKWLDIGITLSIHFDVSRVNEEYIKEREEIGHGDPTLVIN